MSLKSVHRSKVFWGEKCMSAISVYVSENIIIASVS